MTPALKSRRTAASGSVEHYLGRLSATLGDDARAEKYFASAERVHQRLSAPIWLA